MTRFRFLTIAAPILFVAAAAPRPVADLAPGLTYTFITRVQMTDPGGKTTDRVAMSGHASVLGDRARIDMDSLSAPMSPAQQQHGSGGMQGVYFLALNRGKQLVFVDPEKKQYADMGPEGMLKGLSSLTSATGGLIKIQAKDVHMDAEKIGAGPTILGHATVHYRMTNAMTMSTKVLFKTMTSRDSTISDMYYAPDLKNFINPFLANSQAMMGSLDMFGPEYKQQYMAAYAKLYQGGAPLRTVSTTTSTDGNGKVRTSVSTTEVTQLSTGNVNESLFDIPADYQKLEMTMPTTATASASGSADSAAPHPADSANGGKKSLVKKGLRGLFGRPR